MKRLSQSLILLSLGFIVLVIFPWLAAKDWADAVDFTAHSIKKAQILDRTGRPLSVTYENDYNLHDTLRFSEFPEFLKTAFIISEDQRFFSHGGVDWQARAHAVVQNLSAWRAMRGASTISEQVVRIIEKRPRTIWSRWMEGFAAGALEDRSSKEKIFTFYLNQLPYAKRRRGVVQAARLYFDRELSTLSKKEMLALVVLSRAPDRFDLWKNLGPVNRRIHILLNRLVAADVVSRAEADVIDAQELELRASELPVEASHFVRYVSDHQSGEAVIRSTLDSRMQDIGQRVLKERLTVMKDKAVSDASLLLVDHERSEILAWVNVSLDDEESFIDTVRTPRQPGSTLKSFLYAQALEKGFTPVTRIDDAPLARAVGVGLHKYRNYSRRYYGLVPVRAALGNSLNIPAVKTAEFVGISDFLEVLHHFGFASLTQTADYYGEGLALGNGEVTLFELVQGYAALARGGMFEPLKATLDEVGKEMPRRVVSRETATLIADILSDPEARRLEFGRGGVMQFPLQTAIKTGTSSDYRDVWAVGFNRRYAIGVWMGNLNRASTKEVTGASGPALVMRSMLSELTKGEDIGRLKYRGRLRREDVCIEQEKIPGCRVRRELFDARRKIEDRVAFAEAEPAQHEIMITQPQTGLWLARDPRIPDELEVFPFEIETRNDLREVTWFIDGREIAVSQAPNGRYLWPIARGWHRIQAKVALRSGEELMSDFVAIGVRG